MATVTNAYAFLGGTRVLEGHVYVDKFTKVLAQKSFSGPDAAATDFSAKTHADQMANTWKAANPSLTVFKASRIIS